MAEATEVQSSERAPLTSDADIANAMSRFVDPPKPRDDKGRFAPNQQQEAQQPEEQPAEQQATEQPQEAEQTEQAEVQEPAYVSDEDLVKKAKVKVDGEEIEIPLKDALQGYIRQADYTRKTQELSAKSREIETKSAQALEAERKQYISSLTALQATLVRTIQPELGQVNWQQLANDNPAEYVRLQARAQQVHQALQGIMQEQQRVQSQSEQKNREEFDRKAREGAEKVAAKIPNWNDELRNKLIERGTKTYGFSAQELGQFTDHRIIEMLHDANAYHSLKDDKPLVEKKVQQAQKVMRPGNRDNRPAPKEVEYKAAREQLKKTGSIDAFAAALKL